MRKTTGWASVCIVLCLGAVLRAEQQPYLVGDINSTFGETVPSGLTYTTVGVMNGLCYFSAYTAEWGMELWATDGTAEGTHLVCDIAPGSASSNPDAGVVLGNHIYFPASDASGDEELWKSDGTPSGTVRVADINPNGSSWLEMKIAFNSEIYFLAADGVNGKELWKTDGETLTMLEVVPGSGGVPFIPKIVEFQGKLFFRVSSLGNALYCTDGVTVSSVPGTEGWAIAGLQPSGSLLYFAYDDGISGQELWAYDGQAPFLVRDINPGSADSNLTDLMDWNGTLYFAANDGLSGKELWRSSGTEGSTELVADIKSGLPSSNPAKLTVFGDNLVFNANGVTGGIEPHIFDGVNVNILLDVNPATNSTPDKFTVSGSLLYFIAHSNTVLQWELWVTDGTSSGTVALTDFADPDAEFTFLTPINDELLFFVDDGNIGLEPWVSDGTPSGTGVLTNLAVSANGSLNPSIAEGIDIDGICYFAANDGVNGLELWRSDGTASGTYMVKDINPGSLGSAPATFAVIDSSHFMFTAADGVHGKEPWISDGTEQGTMLVADVRSGMQGSSMIGIGIVGGNGLAQTPKQSFVVFGDFVYFNADNGTNGIELWRTDGTTTELWADINPGTASGQVTQLFAMPGIGLFFSATDGGLGAELWMTDGISTWMLNDIWAGSTGSYPQRFYRIDSTTMVFVAQSDVYGVEPWIWSSASPASATLLADISPGTANSGPTFFSYSPGDGLLYFSATDGINGQEPWQSQLTPATTIMVADLLPGSEGSNPKGFLNGADGKTYFHALNANEVPNIWSVDSTSAPTPIFNSAALNIESITTLTLLGGELYFRASDPDHGAELWTTDGTTEGTYLLRDIAPGPANSGVTVMTNDGQRAYLSATAPGVGKELWVLPLDSYASFGTSDAYDGAEDELLVVEAPGLLGNDNPAVEVVAFDPVSAQKGTVAVQPDGSFTYLSYEDFSGIDSFAYTIRDTLTGYVDTLTVTLYITPVADMPLPPTAEDVDAAEDAPVTLAITPGTTTDRDGSEEYSVILADIPSGSSLSVGTYLGEGAWEISYAHIVGVELTLPPNFDQSFAVTVTPAARESTGGQHTLGTSTQFTVNMAATNPDAPILKDIPDQRARVGRPLELQAHATDPDTGDTLTYTLDTASLATGAKIDPVSGKFTWTPAKRYAGTKVKMTVIVTDSFGLTDTKSFYVTIAPLLQVAKLGG